MTTPFTRRTFLAGAAGAGVVALTGNWRALGQSPTEVARGGVFAQSVASGQPSPDGITLWTKLSQLERPGLIQYEVSRDPDFRSRARPPQRAARRRPRLRRHHPAADAPSSAPASSTTTASSPATARRRSGASARSAPPTPTSRSGSASSPARSGTAASTPRTPRSPRSRTSTPSSASATTSTSATTTSRARAPTRPGRTGTATSSRCPSTATSTGSTTPIRTSCGVRETHSLFATWDDHEVEDNYAGDQPGEATPVHRVPFLAAPRQRLPGVLRAHADRARRRRARPRLRHRQARPPRRAVRARPAPLPLRPAVRRPRRPALPGGREPRPHDARRRAEGVVHGRARRLDARPGSSSATR